MRTYSMPLLARTQTAVRARVLLIGVLSLTLVSALRWAMNVTQANARQLSANVGRWRDRGESGGGEPYTPIRSGN